MAEFTDTGSGDRLSFTLFLAAAIHALVILGIGYSVDAGRKLAPTLNITLATHKDQAPDKADFLAQHNQQASGTLDEIREITTMEQADFADTRVHQVNPLAQQKATTESQNATQLLSTVKASKDQVNRQDSPDKTENREEKQGEDFDAPIVDPEYASLQAKLDRLKQEEANKPRIRRLISVSTRSAADAAYLNAWAQKVESIGNANFPQQALDEEIFGRLRMAVLVDSNGLVKNIDISQSSGHRLLDDFARQIIRLAAPFEHFPPEILKNADQLEIIRTWEFSRAGVNTSAQN